jgi:hypothetical protein
MTIDKKLGYYICDGIEFESKIHACMHSSKTQKPVNWIFNDLAFQSHNWEVEPSESLDELYDKRARDLREKYDYLILSYSGGSDSHNILMAFLRQGLLIDELLINTVEKGWKKVTVLDPNNKSSLNSGAEHYLQTLPRLKELENQLDKTKITICDLTDYASKVFLDAGDASWVLDKREALNPIGITRFNYIYFDEVRKQFDKQKRIGLILGVEKPKSLIQDGDFYIRFNDRSANMVTIINHFTDYDNTTLEYFYWSPDAVPLLIKQGHIIKQWLEVNPRFQQYWDSSVTTYKSVRFWHEKLLRSVLYSSTWNDDWFQVDKAVLDWHSEFDNWFFEGYKNKKEYQIWSEGVEFIKHNLKDFLRDDNDTVEPDGLKLFIKKYKIGKMRTLANGHV